MTKAMQEDEVGDVTRKEAIPLPQEAYNHLRAALQQMELLLRAQHVDEGMKHLVGVLRHLRTVGQYLA